MWTYDLVKQDNGQWMAVRRQQQPNGQWYQEAVPDSDTSPGAQAVRQQVYSSYGNPYGTQQAFQNLAPWQNTAAGNAFTRSDTLGSGLSTGTYNYTPEAAQSLIQNILNGTYKVNTQQGADILAKVAQEQGAQVPQNFYGGFTPNPANANNPVGGRTSGGVGGIGGDIVGMTPEMINAITNNTNSAAQGAYSESLLTGYVMMPKFDANGQWSYDYYLDPSGQRIQTQAGTMNQAQIEDMAAQRALQTAAQLGKILDPQTGQYVPTTQAVQLQLQDRLNQAQIRQIDADIQQSQQKISEAQREFDTTTANAEKARLDQLQLQRDQMSQQNAQFQQTYGLQLQQIQEAGRQFDVTQSGIINGAPTLPAQQLQESRRQFDVNQGWQQQQELANQAADPTRIVSVSALANILGGSRGGATAISPAFAQGTPGNTTANVFNPAVPISPEINKVLSGGIAPAFGNPQNTPGGFANLQDINPASGDFSKIVPAAYMSLTPTGQQQYAAIAQARQPGLKPADLTQQIRANIPTNGLAPSIFS
jgi:hypothetical protein